MVENLDKGVQKAWCIFWVKRLDLVKGEKERGQFSWLQPAKAAPKASISPTSYCYLTSYQLSNSIQTLLSKAA